MKQVDLKSLPLSVLADIDRTLAYLNEKALEYKSLIVQVPSEQALLRFVDLDKNSTFYFELLSPYQDAQLKTVFTVNYLPHHEQTLKKASTTSNQENLAKHFERWIGLLKTYDTFKRKLEDPFLRQYQQEFYDDFELVDDDADTAPFEHSKQIVLYNVLMKLEEELEAQATNNLELAVVIEETQNLKENIQRFTKKMVVSKLASIFAKIKKHGIKLLLEVWSESRKELIKRAISGGLDGIEQVL